MGWDTFFFSWASKKGAHVRLYRCVGQPRTWRRYLYCAVLQIWICIENIPSGYVKIAIENGHRNSEFSHKKW